MPMKNAALYIEECLESVRNQTYRNWILVVIDDASEDASAAIVQQIVQTDARILYIRSQGIGVRAALQYGYDFLSRKSDFQFISRMDADDVMTLDKLEQLFITLANKKMGTMTVGKVQYKLPVQEGYQKYAQWLNTVGEQARWFDEIYKECTIPSCAWLMQREDFDAIGGFSGVQNVQKTNFPEDYDLCFRVYAAQLEIVLTDAVVHLWRDHPTRATRNDQLYMDNTFLPLKIHYFLELDWDPDLPLILWGAGKKGKRAARLLLERKVDFIWISNNPKKIGKEIYNTPIVPTSEDLPRDAQALILVANPEEQNEIKAQAFFKKMKYLC